MNSQMVVEILRQALLAAFWISLPLLAVGFLTGIVVSLVQIVTSIQDPGFSAVPRLAVFLGGFLFFLPWMLARMTAYGVSLFGDLGRYAR